jgi:membrane-associated protease RseP (regulator of RpoE activity)
MSKETLKQIGFAVFTLVVYTTFINWKAAILLTLAIAFHEYSHLWAAKRLGLPTRGFYLVPFMGGVSLVAGRYRTYAQQAFVVIMGPVGGGLLAAVCAGVYFYTGSQHTWIASAALWMAVLNLFNLLPLSFLDGGQMMRCITYSINKTLGVMFMTVSTVVGVIIMFKFFNPVLGVLIIVFGGAQVLLELRDWKAERDGKEWLCTENWTNKPKSLSVLGIVLTTLAYLAAAGFLFLLANVLYNEPDTNMNYFFQN